MTATTHPSWTTYAQVKAERRRATLAEAATILGVAPSTLRHQIRNGKLRALKAGRDWHVSLAAIRGYSRDHLRTKDTDGPWEAWHEQRAKAP